MKNIEKQNIISWLSSLLRNNVKNCKDLVTRYAQ